MTMRKGALLGLLAVLVCVGACTPARPATPPAPVAPKAAVAPSIDAARVSATAADPSCNVYCQDACAGAPKKDCRYETAASCVSDCVPGCEHGDVKPDVTACGEGAARAPTPYDAKRKP